MSVPVLAAVTGASWEAALVAGLERTPTGITVVRRCVDLADLLAAARPAPRAVRLLSADLRRLDRDALARLAAARVAVVGLYAPGDEQAETRLRQLGVVHLLPADASPVDIAAAMSAALADQDTAAGAAVAGDSRGASRSRRCRRRRAVRRRAGGRARHPAGWSRCGGRPGHRGAPPSRSPWPPSSPRPASRPCWPTPTCTAASWRRSSASSTRRPAWRPPRGWPTTGSSTSPLSPPPRRRLAPDLRVLTGISRADRWPELRPSALEQIWELARSLAAVTVVDLGFCLEQDEELSFDTAAPRRNGATLATLVAADTVLAVGAADPVGMQRLLRGLAQLHEVVPGALPRVVVNRVRRGAVGADPEAQLAEALDRYAGVRDVAFVPEDRDGFDAALLQARTIGEVSPESRCPDRVGRRRRRSRRAARSRAVAWPAAPRRLIIRLG